MLSTTSVRKYTEDNIDHNDNPNLNQNIFIKRDLVDPKTGDNLAIFNKTEKPLFHNKDNNINNLKENKQVSTKNLELERPKMFVKVEKTESDIFDNTNYDTMIEFDKESNEFNIFNKNKEFIGCFKPKHIIKLSGSTIDINFMGDSGADYINGIEIINKMILKNIKGETILYDFTESPFMGNISILIKLNSSLESFEKEHLDSVLNLYPNEKKKMVKHKIQEVMYKLLIHTLKILSMASIKINKDSDLSKNIIKYSTYICSRIDSWVKKEINEANKNIKRMETTLNMCRDLRNTTINKLTDNMVLLKQQNENILNLVDKLKSINEERNRDIVEIKEAIKYKPQPQLGGANSSTLSYDSKKDTENYIKSVTLDGDKNNTDKNINNIDSAEKKTKKYFKSEEESVNINVESDSEKIIAI